MKRLETAFILLACIVVSACGSARSAPAPKEHLLPAAKVLTKGIQYYRQGCYDRSLDLFLRAHELYTAADDRAGAAMALNNIGNIHRARQDLDRSLIFYDGAAEIFEEISHKEGRTRALVNRASALLEAGRLIEAEKALFSARAGVGEDRTSDAGWMLVHGILLSRKGAADEAEAALRSALERAMRNRPELVPGIHYALSRLLLDTGRAAASVEQARKALFQDRRAGSFRKTADDLSLLGSALNHLGRSEEAAAAIRRAVKIYALLGDTAAVAESVDRLRAAGKETVHPLTLDFVERWLRGDVRSGICR